MTSTSDNVYQLFMLLYDFSGYDWNSARMVNLASDGTLGLTPCSYDSTATCYDMANLAVEGERNVMILGSSNWYEDFPNIDFSLLSEGVVDSEAEQSVTYPSVLKTDGYVGSEYIFHDQHSYFL